MNLEDLGFTKEELRERVIERYVESLRIENTPGDGEREHGYWVETKFHKDNQELIKQRIREKLSENFDKFIKPRIDEKVDNLTLQLTNRWGEAKGEEITFKEYMVKQAEEYINQKVDATGRTKAECKIYDTFSPTNTTLFEKLIDDKIKYVVNAALHDFKIKLNEKIEKSFLNVFRTNIKEMSEKLTISMK